MISFLTEALHLAQPVVCLFALFAWTGTALFFLGLSKFYVARVALIAPVFGLALLACVLTPFSLAGWSISEVAWPVFFTLSIFSTAAAAIAFARSRKKISRRMLKQIARHLSFMVCAFCAVIFVSTYIMTAGAHSQVTDVWGNGDNVIYWRVGDYLIRYPSQLKAYDQQTQFRNSVTREHLERYSRTGSMATLSFVAVIAGDEHVETWINPFIIVSLISLLGLLKLCADALRWRLGFAWPLLMFQSYLYFPLLFSYLNQIHSTLALFAAYILFIFALGTRHSRAHFFISGILAAGATLAHPLGFLIAPTLLVMTAAFTLMQKHHARLAWKNSSFAAMSFIPLCGYYFARSANEVFNQTSGPAFVGWTWPTLPAALTVLSLSPVLGAIDAQIALPIWVESLIAAALVSLIIWSLRTARARLFFVPLLLAWAVWQTLPGVSLIEQKENASHIWVKILSVFAPFLLLAMAHACAQLFARRARAAAVIFFGLWFTFAIGALRFSSRQGPMYGHELVELIRSQLTDQKRVLIQTLPDFRTTPIFHHGVLVENDNRLALTADDLIAGDSQTVVPTLFCWDQRTSWSDQISASKGVYACGLPPSSLNLENTFAPIWQLSHPTHTEGEYAPASDFVLSAPPNARSLHLLFSRGRADFKFVLRWNGRLVGNVVVKEAETQISLKLEPNAKTQPYAVIGLIPLSTVETSTDAVHLRAIYLSEK